MSKNICFDNSKITAIASTVGPIERIFMDDYAEFGISDEDALKLHKNFGFNKRRVVDDRTTTVDLCLNSARNIISNVIDCDKIEGVIFVTQSANHQAPSSAIFMQDKLGIPKESVAFDVNLGCSGFVYGLFLASSLIETGLDNVLLMVGDVASRLINQSDRTVAPIMGDAGSAILLQKGSSKSFFQMYSDGSGHEALIMKNSGLLRTDLSSEPVMTMDGAAVFNFTIKEVPNSIKKMLDENNSSPETLDYFVLHQPNKYILKNIQKRLKIPSEKIPMETQSVYGNQNSASIPGTINGFLNQEFETKKLKCLFSGFGIGLSWGSCIVETDSIYCPKPFTYGG
mgnify:CR=1 FL=1